MANIREYNMNGTLILGIDHGYGNIKTAHRVFPTTSAAGGKVPEQESDVGKPDGAQSEGRLSSGSCVFGSGQTYGNDVPCSRSVSAIRLQKM